MFVADINDARTATLLEPVPVADSSSPSNLRELGRQSEMQKMTLNNPPRRFRSQNTPEWRRACIPASNGHASARGLTGDLPPIRPGANDG